VIADDVVTPRSRGLCLEVLDLLVGKVVAGREKDLEYLG
jgi:hypothetical protein